MINNEINNALKNLIYNPLDPLNNFILGYNYEINGQLTSAVSFYLRAAEFSTLDFFSYESLLRCAICIEKEENRVNSVKGILLRAISLMPKRPEAYFVLSKVYEKNKDWHESYTTAVQGELMINNREDKTLMIDIEYIDGYVLTFQRAIAAWSIGLFSESSYLLRKIYNTPNLNSKYKTIIEYNFEHYSNAPLRHTLYDSLYYNELKYKFKDSINIKKNYSQAYQDMFVLTMLDGKKNGMYIEIGCNDPFIKNNTVLLEQNYNWTGISIYIDNNSVVKFNSIRKNKAINADATKIDFKELLSSNEYDYLQIDCDPATTSYIVLQRIPLERIKFAVITFEHDYAIDNNRDIKRLSRKYLKSFGYKMIVNNIAEDSYSDFEDWWIHPDLISNRIVEEMLCISDNIKRASHYMLNKL